MVSVKGLSEGLLFLRHSRSGYALYLRLVLYMNLVLRKLHYRYPLRSRFQIEVLLTLARCGQS